MAARFLRVTNVTREVELGHRVRLADRWWSRLRGYLARPEPQRGEGILLLRCRAIHMIGMAFPLDVLFLSGEGRVVSIFTELQPGARTPTQTGAASTLEVPVGTVRASGTKVGDRIEWLPAEPDPPSDVSSYFVRTEPEGGSS